MAVALAAGVATAILSTLLGPWTLAPMIGWDVAALVFVVWTWQAIWWLDPGSTARHAVRDDPTRPTSDLLLLVASVASLVTIGIDLVAASDRSPGAEALQVGLGVFSVVVSWTVVHTVYTLLYARLYYTGAGGGIDFNDKEPPQYSDFAYLAFTLGMTFQVSDTDLTTKPIRTAALRHALLSYVFGTVIVATTINLVAGLIK